MLSFQINDKIKTNATIKLPNPKEGNKEKPDDEEG